MQYIYLKPQLQNLSQGERIAFVRQFRRMKLDDTKDKTFKCSCVLLLEDYDEFYIYFGFLDLETQKLYSNWAIYNLLPNEYKEKV